MQKRAVAVVLGYNVANVLEKTIRGIPKGSVDHIIVVDDGSKDGTGDVARKLGLEVLTHVENRGYGGAQKSGYAEAIRQ